MMTHRRPAGLTPPRPDSMASVKALTAYRLHFSTAHARFCRIVGGLIGQSAGMAQDVLHEPGLRLGIGLSVARELRGQLALEAGVVR
jgi:hypothetical protein